MIYMNDMIVLETTSKKYLRSVFQTKVKSF